jgi:hypothetical protein
MLAGQETGRWQPIGQFTMNYTTLFTTKASLLEELLLQSFL